VRQVNRLGQREGLGLTPLRPPVSRGQRDAAHGEGGGRPCNKRGTVGAKPLGLTGLRVRVTACGLPHTPLEGRYWCGTGATGNSSPRTRHARENLPCPHAGPVTASGLCQETRLVSVALGGGAATGSLVTPHQDGERERQAKQTVGLRALGPEAPAQSALHK
jgi:hypothetical protein